MSWRDRLPGRGPHPRGAAGTLPDGMRPAAEVAAQARRDAARAPAPTARERELLARRELLTERFTLLQTDLGGAFYEMAIRDHVRLDVLTRKAAELQRVDRELAEVERELRGDPDPVTPDRPGPPHAHLNGSAR